MQLTVLLYSQQKKKKVLLYSIIRSRLILSEMVSCPPWAAFRSSSECIMRKALVQPSSALFDLFPLLFIVKGDRFCMIKCGIKYVPCSKDFASFCYQASKTEDVLVASIAIVWVRGMRVVVCGDFGGEAREPRGWWQQ